jgi:hypothetical protein
LIDSSEDRKVLVAAGFQTQLLYQFDIITRELHAAAERGAQLRPSERGPENGCIDRFGDKQNRGYELGRSGSKNNGVFGTGANPLNWAARRAAKIVLSSCRSTVRVRLHARRRNLH